MGAFPSGQRGQTVNLLSLTSVVRIHPLPPTKRTPHRGVLFVGASHVDSEARAYRVARQKCASGTFLGRGLMLCLHSATHEKTTSWCPFCWCFARGFGSLCLSRSEAKMCRWHIFRAWTYAVFALGNVREPSSLLLDSEAQHNCDNTITPVLTNS